MICVRTHAAWVEGNSPQLLMTRSVWILSEPSFCVSFSAIHKREKSQTRKWKKKVLIWWKSSRVIWKLLGDDITEKIDIVCGAVHADETKNDEKRKKF